ncbi:S-methyl-5-thioribose-1-phosphate isomerase [Actinomycetota bacterium Odt1-20B]
MTNGFSLAWDDGAVVTVDQRHLPHETRELRLSTVGEVVDAIATLAIRGAPAIGLAGALGVALSAHRNRTPGGVDEAAVVADAERLVAARPTAVNLEWGVRRVLARIGDGADGMLAEALDLLSEDAALGAAAVAQAAALVESLTPDRPLRLLTHCNTGRLATGSVGTALGAILRLAERRRVEEVLVDETRPLLQGARLTAWELAEADVPYRLCVDSAAASAMARGLVDCVLVGADRIAANGDTANKIGTYGLAVAAARHGVPFVVVAPESTWDPALPDGSGIVVEERASDEVTRLAGVVTAPVGAPAYNPAFDVTPAGLITAIVTERRVFRPRRDPVQETAAGVPDARIRGLLEEFPDYPEPGVLFRDLSALYAEPGVLTGLAARVDELFGGGYERVLAVESRGFVLGAALAAHAGTPLTLARKPGKLPGAVHSAEYSLEYGQDRLELRKGAISPGERVLCVDDVLATGGTLGATARLVEASGAEVAGLAVVVELTGLGGREHLAPYKLASLCEVPA